ncbi:MAG: hypothetical protein JSS87_02605 [Acidobacteria bacterium]|nr:hypothetical protein [Acidobacteriota bacterium]
MMDRRTFLRASGAFAGLSSLGLTGCDHRSHVGTAACMTSTSCIIMGTAAAGGRFRGDRVVAAVTSVPTYNIERHTALTTDFLMNGLSSINV